MKVLVTGANGFVGRALCNHLRQHGLVVRGTVRHGGSEADGTIAVGGLGSETDWDRALAGVDVVAHLAARVHVLRDDALDPRDEYRRVNVLGTRRLAEAAQEAGVRRFVLMSSAKVNGEGRLEPYSEPDEPCPQDAYACSKWEAELALASVAKATGLDYVVVRPPLIYGPGVKANFLQLLEAVARGVPLPLAGIRNRRSFVYVENLVDALRVCILAPSVAARLYMVSDGDDVSTPELVRRMAAALGVEPPLFSVPEQVLRLAGRLARRKEAIERLVGSLSVDTAAIRDELAWRPPFRMAEGLAETVRWWKAARGAPRRTWHGTAA